MVLDGNNDRWRDASVANDASAASLRHDGGDGSAAAATPGGRRVVIQEGAGSIRREPLVARRIAGCAAE